MLRLRKIKEFMVTRAVKKKNIKTVQSKRCCFKHLRKDTLSIEAQDVKKMPRS